MPKIGKSISVKCSKDTSDLINGLMQRDPRFQEMQKTGVVLNPSWFFKFAVNYTLMNLKIDDDVSYAYDSHYADFLDNNLKN